MDGNDELLASAAASRRLQVACCCFASLHVASPNIAGVLDETIPCYCDVNNDNNDIHLVYFLWKIND